MLMVIIVFVAVLLVLTWCMIRVSSQNSRQIEKIFNKMEE
jgi:preprotein translocase subunit YajC